jgi:hypothetical protein
MQCVRGLLVLWSVISGGSAALAQDVPLTVFIGPQVREGFQDVDAGVRDSIRDLQREARQAGFTVVESPAEATLSLIVLGRGILTRGSVGFGSANPSGVGSMFVVPNTTPTLSTVVRVGDYEKPMQSEAGNWGRAAAAAVQDLVAWWDANESALRARQKRSAVAGPPQI